MTPIKYLLYDVDPNEGLNKQRRSGVFFLRRAMQMGRTLVLPRCRLLARHRHRVSNGAAADELSGNDIFVRPLQHEHDLYGTPGSRIVRLLGQSAAATGCPICVAGGRDMQHHICSSRLFSQRRTFQRPANTRS